MEDEEEGARPCKVVLIGESGVGKTSIITRFTSNTFSSQLMSTPGGNFVTKNMIIEDENQSIKFEIWDTAGQERYRSLIKVFYKDASACVLVYDITRKSSFDEIKNYWVKEIKEKAPEDTSKKYKIFILIFIYIVLALAGNKNDMYEFEEVNNNEGLALAKELNAIYLRISAKDQKGGIDELFKSIGKQFLNPKSEITSNMTKEELKSKGEKLMRDKIKNNKKKKKCC